MEAYSAGSRHQGASGAGQLVGVYREVELGALQGSGSSLPQAPNARTSHSANRGTAGDALKGANRICFKFIMLYLIINVSIQIQPYSLIEILETISPRLPPIMAGDGAKTNCKAI